jgi:hypothetical protein
MRHFLRHLSAPLPIDLFIFAFINIGPSGTNATAGRHSNKSFKPLCGECTLPENNGRPLIERLSSIIIKFINLIIGGVYEQRRCVLLYYGYVALNPWEGIAFTYQSFRERDLTPH